MPVGSGIGTTLGMGIESTWGNGVAPTKFLEFESESLELQPKRTWGKGIYGGVGVTKGTQHLTTTTEVSGDIKTPIYFKGMGQLLGSLMGSLGVAPVQQAASIAYLQTHAFNIDTRGQSLSIQKAIPQISDGVLKPYTAVGCKVVSATFEISVDEFARATFTVNGKDLLESSIVVPGTPTQALTAATYQTQNPPFHWAQGVFKMGTFGSEAAVSGVRKATITIKRGYADDRYYLDGSGRKQEQISNDFVEISGTFETDYIDKTVFADVFANNGNRSCLLTFTGPTAIASTYFPTLSFALPQTFFTGESPKVGGPDLIKPSIGFRATYDETNVPASISYLSTDVTL